MHGAIAPYRELSSEKTAIKEIKKLNTGIFSGSFNPVHIGHLVLANWLCEFTGLDEVWFVITPHNQLKDRSNLMDDRFRYELVEASIAGYPKFKASDFGFSLPSLLTPSTRYVHLKKHIPTVSSISSATFSKLAKMFVSSCRKPSGIYYIINNRIFKASTICRFSSFAFNGLAV